MSKPRFLARRDLRLIVLPVLQNPQPAAQPPPQDNPGVVAFVEGETESSRLSLEEEIDEFYFEEDIPKAPLIELSNVEGEPDRNSVIGAPPHVIACSDDSSDEEVDNMASNKGKSLRELMTARDKGQTSKEPTKSQIGRKNFAHQSLISRIDSHSLVKLAQMLHRVCSAVVNGKRRLMETPW